jgi:ubiquinone/menaquinone biosynthesis C-methylase UbiE/DNA-binding transcriptional ArsR family regulator
MNTVKALAVSDRTAMPRLLDHMTALADSVRCRMLLLLERHELTVSELCGVLQLPQSTVSRHLKTLADDGWVHSRRDGTSRYYGLVPTLGTAAARLWPLIREQASQTTAAEQDARRVGTILAERRSKSVAFFSTAAGQWDHLRGELFGQQFQQDTVLAMLDPRLRVGDLGCGTGQFAALIAPYVARVVAVDGSHEMLAAAETRLAAFANVDVRRGALESLPIGDAELDVTVMALVLHHVPDPTRALAEAARVLVPGGRLIVVDMQPHDRAEYQQQMGHVWLGFAGPQIARALEAAGFTATRVDELATEAAAKGPALFRAVAVKSGS